LGKGMGMGQVVMGTGAQEADSAIPRVTGLCDCILAQMITRQTYEKPELSMGLAAASRGWYWVCAR
jgi:hypothetical protein